MDAFSEMGPSVTDTLVTTLTELSASQEAMDNRLNEMSKQFEERNTNLTNKLEAFQKLKPSNFKEVLIVQIAIKILIHEEKETIEDAIEVITEDIAAALTTKDSEEIRIKITSHHIYRLRTMITT